MNKNLANIRLRQIMESRGLTAKMIGDMTGWNATKVSRILNNQREMTSSELQEICAKMSISEAEFFREGYMIVEAGSKGKNALAELLANAGRLYYGGNRGKFEGSKVGELIRKELPALIVEKTSIDTRDYKVEGSIGKGQYAEVAWISIFDKAITETATRGIYIVFLYSADGKSVYLSLNQGYTYFSERFSSKEARKEIVTMAEVLRGNITANNSRFVDSIDLGATKPLGRGYEAGHIVGMKYDFDNMPSDSDIISDIYELMAIYKNIRLLFAKRTVDSFYDFLVALGKGLVNLETVEKEVSTSNASEEIDVVIDDTPKQKQEAVIDDKGTKRYPRDPKTAARALALNKYKCAVDDTHFTFIAKSSEHMYVEAHHLIPISESDKFVVSLDVEANIVPLCSTCHDCIHYGNDAAKLELITRLLSEREARLANAGIFVTLGQLASFYGISLQ